MHLLATQGYPDSEPEWSLFRALLSDGTAADDVMEEVQACKMAHPGMPIRVCGYKVAQSVDAAGAGLYMEVRGSQWVQSCTWRCQALDYNTPKSCKHVGT